MSNDPLIEQKLGDYKILDLLGQGGMARVYRGYDEILDRYSAVKVIEPNLVASEDEEEYRERFLREARAIARLNHPRVVSVFQFGQNENASLYYMAMSFVQGRDLRQILKEYNKQQSHLRNAQVLRIMRDIAEALDYSHKQGVIHRDVKPSNIMVTEDGHAVLTDFGLALNAQEGTIGNTFGSVHYIAPEQAVSSAQAVPQSDLYSLGVVLFEVLTGRVPFEDVSAMSVALKHISDPPPLPSTINERISQQVEEVIIKALDKDPHKRFSTGTAFAHALEGAFAASDDEDTHELDSDPKPIQVPVVPAAKFSKAQEKAEIPPVRLTSSPTVDNDSPTISDSSKDKPAIKSASTATHDQRPTQRTSEIKQTGVMPVVEEERSQTGIYMIVGVLLVLVVILGILLGTGVLSSDDDDNGSGTPNAVVVVDDTEEATEDSALPVEVTEEITEVAAVIDDPSETPTEDPTDTPEPSATETEEPTDTPQPTDTSEPTVTPAPTESDEDILLIYDGRTLALLNQSDRVIDVSDLTFIRIRDDGADGIIFNASEWDVAETENLLEGDCLQVWTLAFIEVEEPAACRFRQGTRQTVRPFWITTADHTDFEVRLNNDTLATCPVVGRINELEPEETFTQECAVSMPGS